MPTDHLPPPTPTPTSKPDDGGTYEVLATESICGPDDLGTAYASGYKDGFRQGHKKGTEEGFDLGYDKGYKAKEREVGKKKGAKPK